MEYIDLIDLALVLNAIKTQNTDMLNNIKVKYHPGTIAHAIVTYNYLNALSYDNIIWAINQLYVSGATRAIFLDILKYRLENDVLTQYYEQFKTDLGSIDMASVTNGGEALVMNMLYTALLQYAVNIGDLDSIPDLTIKLQQSQDLVNTIVGQ